MQQVVLSGQPQGPAGWLKIKVGVERWFDVQRCCHAWLQKGCQPLLARKDELQLRCRLAAGSVLLSNSL